MILLSGHSLTKVRSVPLESMSLQLKERDSTATISAENLDGIGVDSWLLDDREPGAGIVWRVKSIQNAMSKRTVTVNLEHAISALRDNILFGEITPAMMSGRLGATTCTAQEAIEYILDRQNDWVLGTFDYASVSNPYKFDGDSLFDAIETVTSSLTDAWWSYDFTVYPFKLNITAKQAGTDSILRPGRNLRTISRTVDKSGMYTRFYPIGKNDLHIDAGYVERNVNLYGVISHVDTDQSIDSKAELTRWANERLAVHAEPVVTVDVEGLELAAATGESMDKLTLGRICQIPLPEFGTTISERITALNYPDKVAQPEMVRITLANNRQDVTKIISDAMKRSGRGARTSSRQGKEDMAWFEDTNDHVAMVAKGIVGVDAQGNPNWIRLSEIVVSGEGIDASVQSIQGDLVIQEGRIDVTESKVGMTVKTNDTRPVKSYSSMSQFPATGSSSYLYLDNSTGKYYQWLNGAYAETTPLGIKAAEIAVAINNSSGETEARIDADKVYIGNQTSTTVINGKCSLSDVSAPYISGKIADIPVVTMVAANVTGTISAGRVNGDSIYFRNSAGAGYTYTDLKGAFVSSVELVPNGDNTYTINTYDANANKTVVGTFSKAATPTIQAGSWGSGILTVTSTPAPVADYVIKFAADPTTAGSAAQVLNATTNGSLSASGTSVLVPIKVRKVTAGSPPTFTDIGYSDTLMFSNALQSKTVSVSTSQDVTVTPDSGKIGLSSVIVNQIKTQAKIVSPTSSSQVVLPDSGYNYLTSVTVNADPHTFSEVSGTQDNSAGSTVFNASSYGVSGFSKFTINNVWLYASSSRPHKASNHNELAQSWDVGDGLYYYFNTSNNGYAIGDQCWYGVPHSGAGTISLPEASMNTSSNPSSTYSRNTKLGKMAKNAYADYDWVIFRINCTCGATKYVAFDPHQS